MPTYDLTRQFGRTVIDLFEHTRFRQQPLITLNLGGASGSNGGTGGPPGGFNGQLAQKYVTFDITENESLDVVGGSGSTASLVDNLNRIRYWLHPARWFMPHMEDSQLYVDAGIWWTADGVRLNYSGTDMAAPESGKVWLNSSGSLCTAADWPVGTTYLPICEMADSTISLDVRKFFNEGGGGGGSGSPAGSDTQVQYNAAGVFGASSNLVFDYTDFRLGIGGIAPRYKLDVAGTDATSKLSVQRSSDNTSGAGIRAIKSRGTIASPSAVLSGDYLGFHELAGYRDGSNVSVGAYVTSKATEDWASGSVGSNLIFAITINGTGTGIETMTLDASGLSLTTGIYLAKTSGSAGIGLDANGKGGDFKLVFSPSDLTTNRRIIWPDVDWTFPANADGYLKNTGGVLSWASIGGGSGSPAGGNRAIQYNDLGVFGGDDNLSWSSGSQLVVQRSDAGTTNTVYPFRLQHVTSGTAAANFGAGMESYIEDDTGNAQYAGALAWRWHTPTHGSELSQLIGWVNWITSAQEAIVITAVDELCPDGNARGVGSVDIQVWRAAAEQVASGEGSTIVGGDSNRASDTGCTVVGGALNHATGAAAVSTIVGGLSNYVHGGYSAIVGGDNSSVTGTRSAAVASSYADIQGAFCAGFGRRPHISGMGHDGIFMFADNEDADFNSVQGDEAAFRVSWIRNAYDNSHYSTWTTGSDGNVTFDIAHAAGTPTFDFTHDVIINTLTASTMIYSNASKQITSLANASGYLYNDGAGTFSWSTPGSGSPAGSNTQVQYNNNNSFGASGSFTWNGIGLAVGGISGARYLLDVAGTETDSKASVQRSTETNPTSGPGWRVIRSRGTVTSPTAVLDGDYLGYMEFAGFRDTSNVYVGGYVAAVATENWSTDHYGAKLKFGIRYNGSSSGSEPMELTSEGLLVASGSDTGTLTLKGGAGDGSNIAQVSFYRDGSGELARVDAIRDGSNSAGALLFWTKSAAGSLTERARINASGYLWVGCSGTTTYQIDSVGIVRARTNFLAKTSGSYGYILAAAGGATQPGYIAWHLPSEDGASGTRLGYMGYHSTNVYLRLENSAAFMIDGGHTLPGANKTYNLGSSTYRWNTLYQGTSTAAGTSRLVKSKRLCPVCGTPMLRGTGSLCILGEDRDYEVAHCPRCGALATEEMSHLPDAARAKRKPAPDIRFVGFKVFEMSGNSRKVRVDFDYGDGITNATYLGETEIEDFLAMTAKEQADFVRSLGEREWDALEETRLMQDECATLQAKFDAIGAKIQSVV